MKMSKAKNVGIEMQEKNDRRRDSWTHNQKRKVGTGKKEKKRYLDK